jgi:sugar lactone lactonase YvrE
MRIRRVVRDALPGPFLLPHDSQGTIAAGEGGVWVVGGALGARSLTQIDASLAVVKRQITLGGAAPLGAHPGVATGYHTIWLPGAFFVARFDAATGVPLKPLVLEVRGDAGIGGAVASVGAGAGGVWAGAATDEGAAIYRIQPSDGKVVARIPVEGAASEVIVAEGVVWVADEFNGTVSRIDPAGNRVVATISFHGSIDGFAAGNGGAWILDTFARTVTPIDLASNELGGSIPVGPQPSAVAVGFGAVWVTDYNGTLYRIDPDTRAPIETRIGAPLYGLAVDVQNGVIWLAVSPKPTG